MSSVISFSGVMAIILLVICSSAYVRNIKSLNSFLLSQKHGFRGTFYKAAVIGTRLHWLVAICCVLMAIYFLLLNREPSRPKSL